MTTAIMVERVARAIAERIEGPDVSIDEAWPSYADCAEAAIKELVEPTHMMLVRGSDKVGERPKTLPQAYREMMEEALR